MSLQILFNNELLEMSIISLFTMILFYIPLLNISKLKVGRIELLIAMGITGFTSTMAYILFHFEIITSFIVFVSMIILIYIKEASLLLSLLYTTMTIILVFTINNVLGVVFMYIFNISVDHARENIYLYWTITILAILISLPISKMLGSIFEKYVSIFFLNWQFRTILPIIGFFISISIIFIVNVHFTTESSNHIALLIINSVLLLIASAFIVFNAFNFIRFMEKDLALNHNQELLQYLQSYIVSVEHIQFEMRNYRHDVINILFSMYKYVEHEDIQGLRTFFQDNIHPILKKNSAYEPLFKQLENIHVFELNGILTIKFIHAIELGIDVHIEVFEPIEHLNIEIIDLVRVVGILLDNAIEECQSEHNMRLQFVVINSNECVRLIFINQLSTHIPLISKIWEEGYSTKGENRGLGLFSIRQILSRYRHVSLKTEVAYNGKFEEIIQELIISTSRNGSDM